MANLIRINWTITRNIFIVALLAVCPAHAQQHNGVNPDRLPQQSAVHRVHNDPWQMDSDDTLSVSDAHGTLPASDAHGILPAMDVDETFAGEGRDARTFYIDAQARSRGEYRHGYSTLRSTNAKAAAFVNERVRLTMGYQQKYVSLKASVQHTGVWGDTDLDNSTAGNISLFEGWARLQSKQGLFLQAGRMALSYDNERIFGVEDWSRTARSHDGLRLGYDGKMHHAHAILAFNQTGEDTCGTYYSGSAYKAMQALWYHYGNETSPFQGSFTFVNQGVESGTSSSPSTNYTRTVGLWLQYRFGHFYVNADGYYQKGKNKYDYDQEGFLVGGRLGYQHPKWNVELGCDALSGHSKNSSSTSPFNMLFGLSHEFFGLMDYFTNDNMIYTGVIDPLVKVGVQPIQTLNLNLGYHYFFTERPVSGLHRDLGQELDIHASWEALKGVHLEAGYSVMMATSVMRYFKDGDNKKWQNWAWLSLNVDLRVFSTKFKRK